MLRPISGTLTAFKITPTSPPTIATGWTVSSTGRTSPFVTSTDGTSNPIVWAYGHGTNQRLFGYDGETGALIFAGGGANDTISGTRTFNTGIAARGRIYIAGDNKVYAFSVPTTSTPTPTATATATATPTATATANRYGYGHGHSYRCRLRYVQPATLHPRCSTPAMLPLLPRATATVTRYRRQLPQRQPATVAPRRHQHATPRCAFGNADRNALRLHHRRTPTPPASQAVNLSTRMRVQTGDNVGIGGFIITGSAPETCAPPGHWTFADQFRRPRRAG